MAVLGRLLKGSIKFTSKIQEIRKIKPLKWQKKAWTVILSYILRLGTGFA